MTAMVASAPPPPQPHQAPATTTSATTPPKRPRLSLQINSKVTNPALSSSTRPPSSNPRGYALNPSDPTAFNTLSNAYVTAIERASTPVTEAAPTSSGEPMTAINTLQQFTLYTPTNPSRPRAVTPYVATFPDTPVSAHPDALETEAADTGDVPLDTTAMSYPSAMTNTPPLSAGPADQHPGRVFVFSARDTAASAQLTSPTTALTRSPCRRLTVPYTHPSSLRSILRNSPLSTRRQARRAVHDSKAATAAAKTTAVGEGKRVGYNSPLEREIVTNKYTKSHIDLLIEEASPCSPGSGGSPDVVDIARAFTRNELQDGGQTPGPFEDPRRGGAGSSPGGIRKRKRGGEKKRHWVWTIGREEDDDENEQEVGGAVAAAAAAASRHERTSSVDSCSTFSACTDDVDMSDADSVATADTVLSVPAEDRKAMMETA